MPKPLAATGTGSCSNQGTITFSSGSSKLTVGGNAVVVQGQEAGVTIAGCTAVSGSNPAPCSVTSAATQGISSKLTVGGQGVVMDNAQGQAVNAVVPSTWSISNAGQSKLEVSG